MSKGETYGPRSRRVSAALLDEAKGVIDSTLLSPQKAFVYVLLSSFICAMISNIVVSQLAIPPHWQMLADACLITLALTLILYLTLVRTYIRRLRTSVHQSRALISANKMLGAQAITDELSGLYNRRGFLELAQHQFDVSARYGKPLTLVFLDLDNFKHINDTLGHKAGDMTIEEFSRVLKENLRTADVAGRLGGDEFAILLPQTGKDAAQAILRRVENACAEINSKRQLPIMLSAGIQELQLKSMHSLDDLLMAADAAMYQTKISKKTLRNDKPIQ